MQPQIPQTPVTQHRRQIIWQVWVPFIIGVVAMITLGVLATVASSNNFTSSLHWANISIIFMLIPAMMLVLILVVITSGIIYLMAKLLGIIPLQALRLQTLFYQIAFFVHTWANKIIEPMLAVQSTGAAGKTFFQKLGIGSKSPRKNESQPTTTPMV